MLSNRKMIEEKQVEPQIKTQDIINHTNIHITGVPQERSERERNEQKPKSKE